jgi:hypothetical protein
VRIFDSPRRRRRLFRLAVLVAIPPIVYLAIHFSTPGKPQNANGPVIPNYAQPKPSPFTAAEKEAVRPVLAEFIRHAVAREDVSKAWDVAGPDIRAGLTRKQWDRGDIPVVPYPAADRGLGSWSYVKYSYTNSVGLEVFVFPKPGSGYSAMTADTEVVKDRDGNWFVNYWLPEKFHGPPALTAKQKKAEQKAALAAKKHSKKRRIAAPEAPLPQSTRTKGLWLAVPVGLLSLIILAPLTIFLVGWLRNRRAVRDSYR